jgi:predicted ester cyclase
MRKIGQILKVLIPVIALGVLVVFLVGAATRTERNKAIIMRWNDEVWNKGNMAVADEILASNYIRYTHPGTGNPEGIIRGPKAMKQWITTCRTMWPNWHSTAREVIAEGDKVVVRWKCTGTYTGEVEGFPPPNGKPIAFEDICIFHLAGGKIVKDCECYRELTVMSQMGMKLVPAQAEAGK